MQPEPKATQEHWEKLEFYFERDDDEFCACLLDLRARLDALEAKQTRPVAALEVKQLPEVEEPAIFTPLRAQMKQAFLEGFHTWRLKPPVAPPTFPRVSGNH